MSEPWVRFEDDDLLVVSKPAGVNTHRADVHAQDGMYEWVASQRPGDALSVLHRLDKATSGLLLFGKTTTANRSMAAQFEERGVDKRYELLAVRDEDRPAVGECSDPIDGRDARTEFSLTASGRHLARYDAVPHTGRTHQVRVHAKALGIPIVGDADHGGARAARLFLHAAGLACTHPATGERLDLDDARPASFDAALADGDGVDSIEMAAACALESRRALFDPDDTNCFVWLDRHHDGVADVQVELLGDVALVVDRRDDDRLPAGLLDALHRQVELSAVYRQHRPRKGGGAPAQLVAGIEPGRFEVLELGLGYRIDLGASATSSGLFLDQRETRRRLRSADRRGTTVLNTFAHTGALSVAAATAGAETLTLDLSKHYLDWARENFRINGLDPDDHDFMYGDALDWMQRFAKKGRQFDLVIADPPSSSTARKGNAKRWSVERDLHALVESSARLCAPGGTLFVSTNLGRMSWAGFLGQIDQGLTAAGRAGRIETQTLPLDHRTGPGDPPYLKAAWIDLE